MTALLDRFVPAPALRQVDRAALAADAPVAWHFARHIDLYRLRVARLLFGLRAIPDWLGARLRGQHPAGQPHAHIEDFTQPGMGFQILAEEPGQEIAIGAIGQVWRPEIPFAQVSPEAYAAFAEPGFAKVAWSLAVHPRALGGAWLSIDLRVAFTDDAARRHFAPYWQLIGRFSHLIRRSLLREARMELGAVDDEALALPGDDIIARARLQVTHAANIEVPPEELWPWLLQMGADRAGWYSWDRLDNAGRHSAEQIIPELQKLQVGDLIPGTPGDQTGFAVLRVDPERALVLGSPQLLSGHVPEPLPEEPPFFDTWSFVLEPIGDRATRLMARVRGTYAPGLRMALLGPAMLAAHEIMERRQLHNLKRRAEHHA